MTCFRPLQAVRLPYLENPVRVLSSQKAAELSVRGGFDLFKVPCSKCVGCRLDYSKSWAIRCMHESSLYEHNSFVTLTYNDFYNDRNGGSLNYGDVTLFLKRLRKAIDTRYSDYSFLTDDSRKIRYFYCGEYGSKTFRPHFHILFFNLSFGDELLHTVRNGFKLFTSDTLSSFWTDPVSRDSYGHTATGSLTTASAAYVARYTVKKALQGDQLVYFNSDTGEFLTPEKVIMSRSPGIGKDWYDLYGRTSHLSDFVVVDGRKVRMPRYYDNLLEKSDPELFDSVKKSRVLLASSEESLYNSSTERLIVREKVQLRKLDYLPRTL